MNNRGFFSNPNSSNNIDDSNYQVQVKNSIYSPKFSSNDTKGNKLPSNNQILTETTTTTTTQKRITTSTTTTTTTVQTILDIHPIDDGITIPKTIKTVNVYFDGVLGMSVYLVDPTQAIIGQNTFFQVLTSSSEYGLAINGTFTASQNVYYLNGYIGNTASFFSDGTVWITD